MEFPLVKLYEDDYLETNKNIKKSAEDLKKLARIYSVVITSKKTLLLWIIMIILLQNKENLPNSELGRPGRPQSENKRKRKEI